MGETLGREGKQRSAIRFLTQLARFSSKQKEKQKLLGTTEQRVTRIWYCCLFESAIKQQR
jgi:hypothetical protein